MGIFTLLRNHGNDRKPGRPGLSVSRQPGEGPPPATIAPWTLCSAPAATEPSPATHLNKPKSTSDFCSLYLNFYDGGSDPAGVWGTPRPPGTQPLPPGSLP